MSNVVAIGEPSRLTGFALAGVDVRSADDEPSANEVLDRLESGVALLVLTPRAEVALRRRLLERKDLVWVTLPR